MKIKKGRIHVSYQLGQFCIFFFSIQLQLLYIYFYTVALQYQEHFSVMYCVFILMAWLFCLFAQQQLSDIRTIIFFCLPRCGLFPTIECMCFVTGDSDSLFSHGVMEWWKWRISYTTEQTWKQSYSVSQSPQKFYLEYSEMCQLFISTEHFPVILLSFAGSGPRSRSYATLTLYIGWQSQPTILLHSYKRVTKTEVASCTPTDFERLDVYCLLLICMRC